MISLCLLSYKRPDMLIDCINSIHNTADMPFELIVNSDGETDVEEISFDFFQDKKISKFILSNGNNRGVGRSFQNCLGLCEGDYIFKIDADLIFQPKWMSTAVKILENNSDIATVSLFDYNHYKDEGRFKIIEERPDCNIVNDFVSSIYCFRKHQFPYKLFQEVPDDGVHTNIAKYNKLAITKTDFVTNRGFGINSVYVTFVDGIPEKTVTYNQPLIFHV